MALKKKPAYKPAKSKPLTKSKAVELYKKSKVKAILLDEMVNKPAKKAAKKKTGKFKSAMSGKFIKADAAKDNPYSTYRMKPSKSDKIVADIKLILKHKYANYYAIKKIKELVYKK